MLGTAALEIAKAGLGVDPQFWILDLFAIVVGCLLGAFLPAVGKHHEKVDIGCLSAKWFTRIGIVLVVVMVVLAGFPFDEAAIVSFLCFLGLLIMMTYVASQNGEVLLRKEESSFALKNGVA